MDIHLAAWLGLGAFITLLLAIDIVGHVKTPHEPTLREAAWWSAAYVGVAIAFGGFVWWWWGARYGAEYFAGYVTEKSLSLDNLFVFVILIAAFRVPRKYQQEVLTVGIIFAIIARFIFILLGAAIIEQFSWVFYLFGGFLLWTAYSQAKQGVEDPEESEEYRESKFIGLVRKVVPVTEGFRGGHLLSREAGRLAITPLLLAMLAIGATDLMFAFDSIPAIYGLTDEPYIVFATNAFSLLGLRQLYFLVDGLLERLVYLHYGLAAILGFIGFKLIVHALHTNDLPFINGGQGWHAIPEPSIGFSLSFVLVAIVLTVITSVIATRRGNKK